MEDCENGSNSLLADIAEAFIEMSREGNELLGCSMTDDATDELYENASLGASLLLAAACDAGEADPDLVKLLMAERDTFDVLVCLVFSMGVGFAVQAGLTSIVPMSERRN
jgi:hypothetical protein